MIGYPVVVPSPAIGMDQGQLNMSRIAKIVISGDTTLSSGEYDILLDAGDSDRDIPFFVFPGGTMIEDIGFHNFMVWTESVGFRVGDSADSDGFASTVTLVATDTDAAGVIRWMSKYMLTGYLLDSTGNMDATGADVPAYVAWGPRIFFNDTADTGDSGVTNLDTDVFELGFDRHHINIYADGAVIATGGLEVYVKYNFSAFHKMAPSSNLGITD